MTTANEQAQACSRHIRNVLSGEGHEGLRKRMSFPAEGALGSILKKGGSGKVPVSEANWTVKRNGNELVVTGQPEVLALVSDLVKDLNTSDGPKGEIIVLLPKA